jgi:hypothetical protein
VLDERERKRSIEVVSEYLYSYTCLGLQSLLLWLTWDGSLPTLLANLPRLVKRDFNIDHTQVEMHVQLNIDISRGTTWYAGSKNMQMVRR